MADEDTGSTTKDIVDSVKGIVEAIPIYEDMVQPAAKELGKGLVTIVKTVNLALAPLEGVVWGYEKIKAHFLPKVEDRLKNVSPNDIVTPKISVAGPIIEALRYTGAEESLSDLYANLLATSMDKNTAINAHPAFTEIIKQLTPDEAKLISLFPNISSIPLIDITRKDNSKNRGSYITRYSNHSNFGESAECEHLSLVPAYIDNLIRLGLIEIPAGQSYTAVEFYKPLEDSELAKNFKTMIENVPEHECHFNRKMAVITALGRQFANVCVVKKS